jgi:hypothetical protein
MLKCTKKILQHVAILATGMILLSGGVKMGVSGKYVIPHIN